MPHFSDSSLSKLKTCDEKLIDLFNEVVKHYDCTIVCGYRNKEDQDLAFNNKRSKVKWPNSKHNNQPSKAVDVVPYPIDWFDADRFYHFAGFVLGVAAMKGIPLRWGGDWDRDGQFKDELGLRDFPHFELI